MFNLFMLHVLYDSKYLLSRKLLLTMTVFYVTAAYDAEGEQFFYSMQAIVSCATVLSLCMYSICTYATLTT